MDSTQASSRRYELVAWGLLLIWWGLRNWLLADLPNGSGLLGMALILFGLNAARVLSGIPPKSATTSYALFALAWGGLLLLGGEVIRLSAEDFAFATFLVALGAVFLVNAVRIRQDASAV